MLAAGVREEENAPQNWQRGRGVEEADKVEVARWVTVASSRCLKAALI